MEHAFLPDDGGFECIFCGRTASEHQKASGGSYESTKPAERDLEMEDEDDWDAIQEELRRLTRRCRQEAEAREKAELLLAEMKAAFEKLREDVGPIRAWGSSTDGQLGHRGQRPSLVEIRGILRQVACGGAHTAALTDDGVLYIWGRGNEGQLGLGDLRPRAVPTLMKALGDKQAGTTVLQAACGGAHTLALCDNGEVYAWGLNEEGQLGLGASFGKKVNRPELVQDLVGKGVLRIAAGKNFSVALTEAGDVYTWGSGAQMQLGHDSKQNEEYARVVETLREVRRVATGSSAEHAVAIMHEGDDRGEEQEEEDDDLLAAEEQLDRARTRREDALRSMSADVEALELQMNKLDAKLAASPGDDATIARLHALKESIKSEVTELEVVVTGKQQLEESMALLNKHKTNQFRASMLMKWSRPGAGGSADTGGAGAVGGGGFTPRTMAKKQAELKQCQADKKALLSELRDCDDQLEQIELEKSRLAEAADEDPDIGDALEELREQLNESKREKLAELQAVEQMERRLTAELGLAAANDGSSGEPAVPTAAASAVEGGGGAASLDAATSQFVKAAAGLWKKLEVSSIEKLNVGQQESLGVKELVRLSNEQIDAVITEARRAAGSKLKNASVEAGDPAAVVYELLVDNANGRKRLNDYTEGLLVQTAHKMDALRREWAK